MNSVVWHRSGSRFVLFGASISETGEPTRSGLASVLSGTSRVSTPAPELGVVDFVAEHAVEPQDELAGHGDDGDGSIFASLQVEEEATEVVVAAEGGVSGFDEQETEQAVALLADVTPALSIAAGAFLGIQAAVGRDAPGAVEARDRLEGVDDGQRGQQTDAGMSAQAQDARVLLRAVFQLRFDGQDLLGQRSQQREGMLALHGEGAGQGQSRELLQATGGE